MGNYDEQYKDITMNKMVFTDWVSTNKTDAGQETLINRVIEPGTGREIADNLEPDEAIIIESSRELYEMVGKLLYDDNYTALSDRILKLENLYRDITFRIVNNGL